MHELVIRGGTVVDGTGAPAVTAEVREAIANGTLLRSDSDFDGVHAASHFNGSHSL